MLLLVNDLLSYQRLIKDSITQNLDQFEYYSDIGEIEKYIIIKDRPSDEIIQKPEIVLNYDKNQFDVDTIEIFSF